MIALPVLLFVGLLAVLALFQLALVLGAPWGSFVWGGEHKVLPSRLRMGSAISILLYALFATVSLDRTGVIDPFPGNGFSTIAMWIIAAYLLLSMLPMLSSRSPLEKFTMAPASLVLSVLAVLIAIS